MVTFDSKTTEAVKEFQNQRFIWNCEADEKTGTADECDSWCIETILTQTAVKALQ